MFCQVKNLSYVKTVQGERKDMRLALFFFRTAAYLMQDNALCHNSNFLSPKYLSPLLIEQFQHDLFHSKLLNSTKTSLKSGSKSGKAESVKTLHHETMATLAGYRRGATTLCHNQDASAAERAGIRHATCNQRAGGTLLPERIPTPAAMPTRRILRQRLDNNSNRDPRTSPGASVY